MDSLIGVISKGRDKLLSGIRYIYSDVNPSTLTGAIDIIVIEQPDGTLKGGPFQVRFGKIGTLKPENKIVSIRVNDRLIENLQMKLNKAGEAYFVGNDKRGSSGASPLSRNNEDVTVSTCALSVDNINAISPESHYEQNDILKDVWKHNQPRTDDEYDKELDQSGYYSDGAIHQMAEESVNNQTRCRTKSGGKLNSGSDGAKTVNEERSSLSSNVYQLRLSSNEFVDLNLKHGCNDVTFSLTTRYQGQTCAKASIYLWHWYDKIVISDIDGTITKSDVLGQVLPMLGNDWTQQSVVKLFNKICDNRYRIIYVSARAIGQSGRTRDFLEHIMQESLEELPDGPILLSPTSSFKAFRREVIEKKPEQFKIECLKDVGSLFPDTSFPFYAGFGNRTNDVVAYQAVKIDGNRIFTIGSKGCLKNETGTNFNNYGELFNLVDKFFPPLCGSPHVLPHPN